MLGGRFLPGRTENLAGEKPSRTGSGPGWWGVFLSMARFVYLKSLGRVCWHIQFHKQFSVSFMISKSIWIYLPKKKHQSIKHKWIWHKRLEREASSKHTFKSSDEFIKTPSGCQMPRLKSGPKPDQTAVGHLDSCAGKMPGGVLQMFFILFCYNLMSQTGLKVTKL